MTTDVPAGLRPLTMTEAAIPIVALIVLVGMSFYLFGDAGAKGPNQVALVLAAMNARSSQPFSTMWLSMAL